jgi:hypothetical protein
MGIAVPGVDLFDARTWPQGYGRLCLGAQSGRHQIFPCKRALDILDCCRFKRHEELGNQVYSGQAANDTI